ncbi:hypothetical protein ACLVWU_08060 [Bdellovibrio sp. HCB290]|uniref:hypothetical protein n=1 Tax=Bdellovibrio sp. HCB290 TaxID=3394356 RepID=UPI0039B483D5
MKRLIFSGTVLLLSVATFAVIQTSQKTQEKCITVVYDSSRNLEGALKVFDQFPDFQRVLVEMSGYSSGQLERCQVSFIVNSEFDNLVPKPLVEDFLNSKRNVVWMGYNIWSLGDQLNRKLGLRYMGSYSKVSFDRCIFFYRGRSTRCSEPGLSMHPETIPTNEMNIEIMAETRIRGRELTPYLVRSNNLYYLADVNFGNVFQDFLSEFVGARPRNKILHAQTVAGPG